MINEQGVFGSRGYVSLSSGRIDLVEQIRVDFKKGMLNAFRSGDFTDEEGGVVRLGTKYPIGLANMALASTNMEVLGASSGVTRVWVSNESKYVSAGCVEYIIVTFDYFS